jgi:hypothetical protein
VGRIEPRHEKERKKELEGRGVRCVKRTGFVGLHKKGAMNRCPNKFDVEKYRKDGKTREAENIREVT